MMGTNASMHNPKNLVETTSAVLINVIDSLSLRKMEGGEKVKLKQGLD